MCFFFLPRLQTSVYMSFGFVCVVSVSFFFLLFCAIQIVALKILPLFCPILLNTSLTIDEFKKLSSKIKAMIKRIEDLRLRELGESVALKKDAQRMIGGKTCNGERERETTSAYVIIPRYVLN